MRKHLSAETIYVGLYVLPCAANCWRRSVRRARHADLERGEQTDGARSPI